MEARERLVGIAGPRRCQGAGEIVLLGDEVERPVAHPPGLDEDDLGRLGEHVGEQPVVVDQPRQPTLHAVEVDALGEAFPLLATPRFAGDEMGGAFADVVGRHQLAGREDDDLVEVVDRSLVVDAEAGETVDLVAPQVDADRRIGGRREHVDDGAAAGELAAVLDEFLAPVAELDQLAAERVGVDFAAGPHDDRLGRGRFRAELLEQRPHTGDDDGRTALGIAQAPEDVEPLAHRLHARADTLERQRLPAGEMHDLARWQELGEVVGELARHRARRAAHDERPPRRERRQRRDRDRPRHLHDGQSRVGVAERPRQPGLAAQQCRQAAQRCTDHAVDRHLTHRPAPSPTPKSRA